MTLSTNICFRVDASAQMGTGHAMRCLTFANALRERRVGSVFLFRTLPEGLATRIRDCGHDLRHLKYESDGNVSGDLAHSHWLAGNWQADAVECRSYVSDLRPDWVVVDHYALDHRWESHVRQPHVRILAIDDLADRHHDAGVLLDQNLGRHECDYTELVPETCRVLAGPAFALLRPDFVEARASSLRRRETPQLRHIMISLGGMDADNVTGELLLVLARSNLPKDLKLSVVLGGQAPYLDLVREYIVDLPLSAELLTDVSDMSTIMAQADLAIGAAGSTSWERCCLGLPTLLLVMADNQKPGALALDASGAVTFAGDTREAGWQCQVQQQISALRDNTSQLAAMSWCAATITDGFGTRRCIEAMQQQVDI